MSDFTGFTRNIFRFCGIIEIQELNDESASMFMSDFQLLMIASFACIVVIFNIN